MTLTMEQLRGRVPRFKAWLAKQSEALTITEMAERSGVPVADVVQIVAFCFCDTNIQIVPRPKAEGGTTFKYAAIGGGIMSEGNMTMIPRPGGEPPRFKYAAIGGVR